MTHDKFNAFCRSLPATTYVVQWGGAHVWKVGGKVLAIGGWQDGKPAFSFKVSDIGYEVLKDQPGLRPCAVPCFTRAEMDPAFRKAGLPDTALRDYLRQSHAIVAQGLSRKRRAELGLATR